MRLVQPVIDGVGDISISEQLVQPVIDGIGEVRISEQQSNEKGDFQLYPQHQVPELKLETLGTCLRLSHQASKMCTSSERQLSRYGGPSVQ